MLSERRIAQGRRALAELDTVMRDRAFLLGDRYTLADIAVYAYAHLAPDVPSRTAQPRASFSHLPS